MLSTDLQISGAGLTCRVCVCLCALSHLFTACGAQTNRTERWLTASLVLLLISGEWSPWALCVSQSNHRLSVLASHILWELCVSLLCAAVLSVTCHGRVVMVTVLGRAEECSRFRRLADDHFIIRVSLH